MEATVSCRLLAVLAVILASVTVTEGSGDYTATRTRRDVIGLGNMISTVTGKNLFTVYTSYNGYGCYCGIGGKGTPVDAVDRCCKRHDRCFSVAQKGACSSSKRTIYSQYYKYSTQEKDNHDDGVHATIDCAPVSIYKDVGQGLCGKAICSCDRDLATCFAKHEHNYRYNRYDRSKCE